MKKNSVLSFLLVLAMLLSMLPVSVFAAETTETEQTTEPEVVYHQLCLGDSLTMYFYISAEKSTKVNATMEGKNATYDLSTMQPNSDGYYEIAVDMAAAQMTEQITLDFQRNDASILQKTYCVRDYAVAILENDYPDFTKNLVKWMLGYGAAAQQYFGINTDNYANAGYEQDATTLPEDYAETSISGCVDGIQFYGASLVFDKQVAVRYYFTADSAEGMTFTANGTPYEAVQKNNMYCVEVPGINPQQYAESIELTVTKGEEALKVSYCPMNYIIRMSEKSSTSESLKALLNAMYGYHTAAVTFVTQEAYEITLGDLSQMQLSEGEEATAVELTATAGNGNVVRYAAVSGDEDVATVSISGDTLTVTPVAMGKSTITVTANADGCESAEQAFELTVMKDVLHYKADGTAYEDGVTIEAWEDSSAGWDHAGSTYKTYIGSATGAFVGDFTVCVNYNTKAHKTVSGNSGYTTRVYMHDYSNSAAYWIFNIPWTSADKANNSVLGSPTSTATTTIPSKEAAIDIFKNCDIALTIKRQGTVVSWVANVTAGEGTSYAGQTFTTQFTLTGVTSEILQLALCYRAFSEYTVKDIKICGTVHAPITFSDLDDINLTEGAEAGTVNLAATAVNGSTVSFSAQTSDENVATVSVSNNVLTVSPVAKGEATVTVTATADGCETAVKALTVKVSESEVDLAYQANESGNIVINAVDAMQQKTYAQHSNENTSGQNSDTTFEWVSVAEEGETGTGIQLTPISTASNKWNFTVADPTGNPSLTFKVWVPEAGDYYLNVFSNSPNGYTDSFFFGVNNVKVFNSMNAVSNPSVGTNQTSGEQWFCYDKQAVTLNEGYNTIHIWARESGVLLRQILLSPAKQTNLTDWLTASSLGTATQLTFNDIPNRTMGMEAETIELLASASNHAVVSFSAASGNTDVASVSISDNVLTVTPLSKGEAQITVTASAPGCKSVSETFTVVVTDGVDLVLFIGQSNMAGRGSADEATAVAEGHAYEFRAISDPTKLYHLEEPFGVNENNAESGVTESKKTGSMVSAFCESYYAATGTPIVAVSCAKGGEAISFFDTTSAVYADACARVNSAKVFLQQEYESGKTQFKLGNVYVVWMQGESDGDEGTSAENYTQVLDRIVNGFKNDIGAVQTFIIPIGTYNGNNGALKAKYNTIRDAQIIYSENNADATVISVQVVDLYRYGYMKDEYHFSQAGYEILGKDAGANMAYFAQTGQKPDCRHFYDDQQDLCDNGPWQEADGKVVIPASAAMELSTYASYSSADSYRWAEYTGGQFSGIMQNSADSVSWASASSAFYGAAQVHYTFHVTNPGRYYLYMFASHPDTGSNSVYASIDSGDMITCSNTVYGEGRWLKGDNWYFDIAEAGDHTITIYARESGIVLHQIMLTHNKDEAVTDGVEQAVSVRGAYEIHEMFKEVDGEVTIELSSALENSKYAYSTAGRAGDLEETFLWERSTGYDGVQVYPDMGITWGTNNISPKVSYQVEFSTPGEYYVMLYSSFKDDASDSVYVSVNNGAIMNCASSFAKGPEKWLGDTAWKINIPYAGVHTINVYPREDGARLHTLLLTQNPEPVQTLVFGDSYTSQTYWKSFDEQLASIGGQTIGVSGSEVGLWIKSVEAMKIYEPKNLVINIGVNDINRGQSGTDCGNEIVTLLGSLQSAFPDSNIFYVSICDNTQYPDLWTEYAASNEIVKAYIDSAENLYYIDYAAAMKAEADNMTNSGFSDGLHPNSDGYALLSQMICDAVTEANQE